MRSKIKLWLEILRVSGKLGLLSFGGPTAHLGYFHNEYVKRRKWLDEAGYAELVALCQFLPGPASSQVGIGIGIVRGGLLGGLLSFLGFTLPSVVLLVLFEWLLSGTDVSRAGWLQGLQLAAVAVVAHAIWGMGQKLTPDRTRMTIAAVAAGAVLLWQTAYSQVAVILLAGLVGLWLYRKTGALSGPSPDSVSVIGSGAASPYRIGRGAAIASLSIFAALLLLLPWLRDWDPLLAMADSFYRTGSLVFGGGHVVLPLLEREAVGAGWISEQQFLAGYGAAQAVPGPLFTFASYIGAASNGLIGAIVATASIFLPAFLLVVGTLPFWQLLRRSPAAQGILTGVNAAVVGLLLAALYDPIWKHAVVSTADFVAALVLFILLVFWKLPPWLVVLAGAAAGIVIELAA
ncbi:chromate efflux transporter [Paenibacillus soyae]|uniref:Chromate efflux transporter n=1 Tax=Paenibacillus soyae TaxID=2969249 RepID=A0A9X2MNK7_9BACL|nr:chromate efflux transporter [Paenibacillus soyae]MCR2803590.1 chromate efflux transporter [Paenibacillus soyae]